MITIRINKLDYKIFMADPDNGKLEVDGIWRCGSCDMAGGAIFIDNELSYEPMRRTVIHELAHAYINAYGHAKREKYHDEDLCEFVSAFADAIIYDTNAILNHYEKYPVAEV